MKQITMNKSELKRQAIHDQLIKGVRSCVVIAMETGAAYVTVRALARQWGFHDMTSRKNPTKGRAPLLTKENLLKAIDSGSDTHKGLKCDLRVSYPTIAKYLKLYDLADYLNAKKRVRVEARIRNRYKPDKWALRLARLSELSKGRAANLSSAGRGSKEILKSDLDCPNVLTS